MIYGIGVDIAEVSRFNKWVNDGNLIERYFNVNELSENKDDLTDRQISALSQHYAARFAAKEAFAKALGTGIRDFDLKDVYIKNDELGKPYVVLENSALKVFESRCQGAKVHISLSHEKEYAIAYVIIEI